MEQASNMDTLVERYGPAPRAFLVVPMVGAFFHRLHECAPDYWFLNLLR
jgi:ESS family glutamate:Na+ symporter